jgi:molybdopterin-guanine dinucleotide biosynthesis protein A
MECFFKAGGRAVKQWLATQDVAWVDFSDCAWAFENINRIDDLRQLEAGKE